MNLPVPADWVQGPGGVKPDSLSWELRQVEYKFVEEFERLRQTIVGHSHQERFDYWLNTFRYLRATGRFACTWGEINRLIKEVRKDSLHNRSIHRKAFITQRERQMSELEEIFRFLLETVSTNGELGTITNWQQHVMMFTVLIPGHDIEKLLGESLPPSCWPSEKKLSVDRIIVPTARTSLRKGEDLRLKVILPQGEIQSARLLWKPLKGKNFLVQNLRNVNRAVWRGVIRAEEIKDDIEYFIEVKTGGGVRRYPAGSPERNCTVVLY